MYNDEFNNNDMYRFTNREVPRDDYAPAPRQENTYTAPVRKQGFFRRTWVKVTALVLACAVVGGAAGYGGAALAKGGSGSGTASSKAWRVGLSSAFATFLAGRAWGVEMSQNTSWVSLSASPSRQICMMLFTH